MDGIENVAKLYEDEQWRHLVRDQGLKSEERHAEKA